jgi:hypothetical protein
MTYEDTVRLMDGLQEYESLNDKEKTAIWYYNMIITYYLTDK